MVAFNFGVIAASLLAIALVVADPNNERLAARELSPEAQTKGRVSDKLDSLGKNLKWLDEAVNQENLNSRVARERMAGYYQLFQDSFQYAIDCGSLCFQSGSVVNVSAYEAFKQMNQLAKDVAQKYGSGASTVLSPFSAYDTLVGRSIDGFNQEGTPHYNLLPADFADSMAKVGFPQTAAAATRMQQA
ncbi:hypothetical protein MJO28_008765 [Puccinia striiformis f. sp. tritici]|uniref:Uncharacterized protein n=3 Tax=Puccinia striiformis TaxID=27350 RepID=A0A2S4W563_9BASI|nr:hypothetical protein Pst134EB_016316 [Puccinia striiformis f. sp. tritici]KAI9603086.1 hypothetical protein H4Q26_002398 [Puccinia striiformis f. sp. tritici PST-130]POW05741.1 hypothetical protein PSHT_10658 [Puccinia striiformis]KAI7949944.1 hypothetical protein MJO28_008765 [Puccinia striiformis f. sp. tritici]KAI7953012.1 hypothetical protein MJO29_008643 [Puccinia striiformis f. sp. tritici]